MLSCAPYKVSERQSSQNESEHDAMKGAANGQRKKLKGSYSARRGGSYACSWRKANYTAIRLSPW